MKRLLKILLIAVLALSVGTSFAASPEKHAKSCAKDWLALVDGKKYEECYDEAAVFFKAMVDKEALVKTLGNLRKMLGEVESRKLISAKRESKMAGAPDGEYVVLVYETDFAKKSNAQEVVVPMLDKDGNWRVSGYYIE